MKSEVTPILSVPESRLDLTVTSPDGRNIAHLAVECEWNTVAIEEDEGEVEIPQN